MGAQGKEIERKFLVKQLPLDYNGHPHYEIAQGYLTEGNGEAEIRLRKKGDAYLLSVKKGKGRVRQETEIKLLKEQYDTLWPMTEGRRLEKVRYEIPMDHLLIELDIYKGHLAPLVTAEVEFDSVEASESFIPPEWMDEDVTGDPRYLNRTLAAKRKA